VLLLVAVLLVAGGGAGAWWFLDGRYTSTPGVLGLSESAAADKLDAAGLKADFGKEAYSETVPAGHVVSTDPGPGAKVLDGGTVTVTLSRGKERYDVPKLKGMTEDQAQDALDDGHLSYGKTIAKWSDSVKKGVVIATQPKAGTTMRPDSPVDLVVSKGPRPITVRDWTGKPFDDAKAWAGDHGLDAKISSQEYSDDVPEGRVISQDPGGGSTVHRGDGISFVVSRGPQLVEVPSVVAHGVDAATDELTSLGFHVTTRKAAGYLGLGYVFSQDPGGGNKVPKGSTITLTLI
jgi:serine/threonine-protein kinase